MTAPTQHDEDTTTTATTTIVKPQQQQTTTSPLTGRIIAGSVGAIITSFAVTPLEVLKVRQQAQSALTATHRHTSADSTYRYNSTASATATTKAKTASAAQQSIRRCGDCGTFIFHNGLMDCVVSRQSKMAVQHFQKQPYYLVSSSVNNNSTAAAGSAATKTAAAFLSSNNPFALLRQIYKAEGLSGIYAGLGPTLIMSVPSTVLYFTAYDEISYRLKHEIQKSNDAQNNHDSKMTKGRSNNNSLFNVNVNAVFQFIPEWAIPLIAGSTSRILAVTIVSPLELIRTRQAAIGAAANNNQSTLHELTALIVKGDNPLSLWKGLAPTLWRDVPFSAIYWYSLEYIRGTLIQQQQQQQQHHQPFAVVQNSFLSGACSGMIAAFLTAPFDVVKTRRQAALYDTANLGTSVNVKNCNHGGATVVPVFGGGGTNGGTMEEMMRIVRCEGVAGLWRGNVARMLKIGPACAIMISCYELGKKVLHVDGVPG